MGWLLPWSAKDMWGKVIVVTGGNSGIGMEIVKRLCEEHANVICVSRDLQRGTRSVRRIMQEVPYAKLDLMICNLASCASIERFVEEFKARGLPLHVLVNNAASYLQTPEVTADGFDLSLQVNYYGTLYLTHLLLPVLTRSAPSRIVMQGSMGSIVGRIPWEDMRGLRYSDWQRGYPAYGASKLMLMMYSRMLAHQLEGSGVDVLFCHPGGVDTPAHSKVDFEAYWPLSTLNPLLGLTLAQTTNYGARPALYCATEPGLQGRSTKLGMGFVWGPNCGFWGWAVSAKPPINLAAWQAQAYSHLYAATNLILQTVAECELLPALAKLPFARGVRTSPGH